MNGTAADERKQRFLNLVNARVQARASQIERRHNACVNLSLGPLTLARRWREERLPDDEGRLDALARDLVDWAIPGERPVEKPFAESDLE